jgi:hypothetical protein
MNQKLKQDPGETSSYTINQRKFLLIVLRDLISCIMKMLKKTIRTFREATNALMGIDSKAEIDWLGSE